MGSAVDEGKKSLMNSPMVVGTGLQLEPLTELSFRWPVLELSASRG